MQFTHTNMIIGLYTKGIEFVAIDKNKVEALHDRQVLPFNQLPEFAYNTIKSVMGNTSATKEEMEHFAFQRWGGLDSEPDIDEKGNPSEPEYLSDFAPAYYDNGRKISDAELRVLQLIAYDDKTIAVKLFISPYTVARHFSSLFFNSGMNKRTELALWATKKGII
jgi:DNA-binding NarL/FixJ family response regulator